MAVTGFIGLGVMGREMASHLVAAGHTVQAFDGTAKVVDGLRLTCAKATTGGKRRIAPVIRGPPELAETTNRSP